MDKETYRMLSDPQLINCTDDPEYNYVSYQCSLAHEYLEEIRTCKCKLDETSDKCRHINQALRKLYGHRIDRMWNESLKESIESAEKVYGFKIPFALQKRLSA